MCYKTDPQEIGWDTNKLTCFNNLFSYPNGSCHKFPSLVYSSLKTAGMHMEH